MNTKIMGKRISFFSCEGRYIFVFTFLFFNALNAQQKIEDLFSRSFDINQYQIVESSNNKVLLVGKTHYIDIETKIKYPYTTQIDSLFNSLPLNITNWIALKDKIYFMSPGGGLVFEFDGKGIKRIDKSLSRLAYFGAQYFVYNNEIYQFGGYGFWKFKSHLLKFDFNLKEWILIDSLSENEQDFVEPLIQFTEGKLYILSQEQINNFNNQRVANKFIYTYDFKTRKKSKIAFDMSQYENYFKTSSFYLYKKSFDYDQLIISNFYNNYEVGVFDFHNNSIKSLTLENLINPDDKFLINDSIIYSFNRDKFNADKLFLVKTNIIEKSDLGKIYGGWKNYYLIVLVGLIPLFLPFTSRKTFLLERKKLIKLNKSIKIDYDEFYFLNRLTAEYKVENQDLISYFDRDGKSYDLNVKRKNAMISNLENKIYSQFKTQIFIKTTSEKDKRQSVYVLKKKLKLASKKD